MAYHESVKSLVALWRVLAGSRHDYLRSSSVNSGTILNKSPTSP